MPTITVSRRELAHFTGKNLPDTQMEEALMLNKVNIESVDGDSLRLEVTPDRPDFYSVEGLGRQLRSWLGLRTGLVTYPILPARIQLTVGHSALRPCVAAGVVRNVRLDDATIRSLFALQETLDLTLGRGRKKAAVGIHDLDTISSPITYKDTSPDSRLHPLDSDREMSLSDILVNHPKGKAYAHLLPGAAYPVFTDRTGIISFAPIINSERTKVTPRTTNIFFEMQGSDQQTLDHMLNILVAALAERGGQIEAVNIIRNGASSSSPTLDPGLCTVPLSAIKPLLGTDTPDLKHLLERMGYGVVVRKDSVDVLVPPTRADIMHYVDVIEDIAIALGFNTFIPETPTLPAIGSSDRLEDLTNRAREALIGLGFTEILNFSLTSPEKLQKTNLPTTGLIELENPVSLDYTALRPSLLPSLLETLSSNTHRRYPQMIFEAADTVQADLSSETKTRNVRTVCACISHATTDLSEILSHLHAFAGTLRLELAITNNTNPAYIPGRMGTINSTAGTVGEIHPTVLKNWNLKNPVTVFELQLPLKQA